MSSFWRPKITESIVKTVKDAYLNSEIYPTLNSAKLFINDDFVRISSAWSQNSVIADSKRFFIRDFGLSRTIDKVIFGLDPVPIDELCPLTTYSLKGITKRFQIRKGKNDKEFLEIWDQNGAKKCYNLSGFDLHGPVYTDGEFGAISVNPSGTKVAYIAEKKEAKKSPFFDVKAGDFKLEDGSEYLYKDTWGEQMDGKSQSVIAILNLEDGTLKIIDSEVIPPDVCPGQIVWSSDTSLVGVGFSTAPRRLGIVYCSNRPSSLFRVELIDDNYSFTNVASNPLVNYSQPRVSPDGRILIWLERDLKPQYPGPHQATSRLMTIDESGVRTVIDNVWDFDPDKDIFSGILANGIPKRCFVSPNTIIFSACCFDKTYPAICNISDGQFVIVKDQPHMTIVDVLEGFVAGVKSTPVESQSLVVGRFDQVAFGLNFLQVSNGLPSAADFIFKSFTHIPREDHPNPTFSKVKFNSIYVGPNVGNPASVPLILWPHGGPHSVTDASFYREMAFFNSLGYAVMLINYRGSLGGGDASVNSLLGNVGDTDVKDVVQACDECIQHFENVDPNQIILFGGSHGGFLVTHLAGQYPKKFRAVVARNPVTNLTPMGTISDIPDWVFNESGFEYKYQAANPDQLQVMHDKSPIAHASKIEAPILLLIGKNDLRVPPSQGHEFYQHLKGLGKDVEMHVYDDNHPLAKVGVSANVFINSALFYQTVLNRE